MSPRKQLKKQIAQTKAYLAKLPRLIDCSRAYGDYTYTREDLAITQRIIESLEAELARLPTPLAA